MYGKTPVITRQWGAIMSDSERLQMLVDTESIRDVVARYFFAIGRRDWEAVQACFVTGAFADYEFNEEKTIERQLALVKKGMLRFRSSTLLGSNSLIQLEGARAESQTMALTAHESEPDTHERTRISTVRYEDSWAKQSTGEWLIVRRRVLAIWKAWLDPRFDDRAGDHRYADEW
jgi:hypothetical protein